MSMDDGPGRDSDALPPFAERVLELTERIPQGRVLTYGDVSEYLEEAARARSAG